MSKTREIQWFAELDKLKTENADLVLHIEQLEGDKKRMKDEIEKMKKALKSWQI
jgi:cell division protein FtsB